MRGYLALHALGQLGDIFTTWHGLRLGLIEANPIGLLVLAHGYEWVVVLKLLLVAAVTLGLPRLARLPGFGANRAESLARFSAALMLAVVAWNSHLLHQV